MIKTGVSLFAGIGGFDLAMERAGIKVVAAVEWDKHAQKVLAKQFPNSEIYGDITGVKGEQLINAGFDPANGIITGGFPCQDLSVAGRRAGLSGSRSGLFWEICRLLDETKAQSFILENVPGLLSSNEGRDMGTVIRALEERGYSIAWRVLDSRHFGVAQRRRRVFIVGNLGDDWRTPAEILALAESSARHSEQSNTKRKDPTYKTSDGAGSNSLIGSETVGSLQASDYKFPQQQQVHENKIVIQEVARLQAFGDYQLDEISSSLQARDYKGATDLVIQPTFFYAKNHQDVRIQGDVINTLAATMGTGGGNTPMVHAATVRRLTPTECERLQGFPDNWTEGQADSHRYKQLGNAVAVPVVEWIIKRLIQATN